MFMVILNTSFRSNLSHSNRYLIPFPFALGLHLLYPLSSPWSQSRRKHSLGVGQGRLHMSSQNEEPSEGETQVRRPPQHPSVIRELASHPQACGSHLPLGKGMSELRGPTGAGEAKAWVKSQQVPFSVWKWGS